MLGLIGYRYVLNRISWIWYFISGKREGNQPALGTWAQFLDVGVPLPTAAPSPRLSLPGLCSPEDISAFHYSEGETPETIWTIFNIQYLNIDVISVSVRAMCRQRAEQDWAVALHRSTMHGKKVGGVWWQWRLESRDGGPLHPLAPGTSSCLPNTPTREPLPIPALLQVPWPPRMLQLCQGHPGHQGSILQGPVWGLGSSSHGKGRNPAPLIPCRGVSLNPDASLTKQSQLPKKYQEFALVLMAWRNV